jgi:tRNA nucleotidyltransferase/poly(A) polymerase
MAMTADMDLYDPYNGLKDLKSRLINTVGTASERFDEDALRMLRAVRFMSQLNFKLTSETEKAVAEHAGMLRYIAVERITAELRKLYRGINVQSAKDVIAKTDMLSYLPFFQSIDKEQYIQSRALSLEQEAVVHIYRDSALQKHLGTLKLANRQKTVIKESLKAIEALENGMNTKLLAYRYEEDILIGVNDIIKLNALVSADLEVHLEAAIDARPQLALKNRSELAADGNTLMTALNAKGGPWLRECLNAIEEEVLLGNLINNEKEIVNWVNLHVKNEDGNIVFNDGR